MCVFVCSERIICLVHRSVRPRCMCPRANSAVRNTFFVRIRILFCFVVRLLLTWVRVWRGCVVWCGVVCRWLSLLLAGNADHDALGLGGWLPQPSHHLRAGHAGQHLRDPTHRHHLPQGPVLHRLPAQRISRRSVLAPSLPPSLPLAPASCRCALLCGCMFRVVSHTSHFF